MLMIKKKLKEKIEEISEKDAAELLDFVEFITSKRDKYKKRKSDVIFGSGHLGEVQGELTREDLYCDR